MTKEQAIELINAAVVPELANCIIIALTEGATVSDKALEQQPSNSEIPNNLTADDCVSKTELMKLYYECRPTLATNVYEFGEKLQALPPVTPTQKWIPVSERLPEDRNIVLVTAYWHETYQVMMASYFGEGLWWCVPFNNCGDHMQKLNPKAWMPLPQPYKEKRGSEND